MPTINGVAVLDDPKQRTKMDAVDRTRWTRHLLCAWTQVQPILGGLGGVMPSFPNDPDRDDTAILIENPQIAPDSATGGARLICTYEKLKTTTSPLSGLPSGWNVLVISPQYREEGFNPHRRNKPAGLYVTIIIEGPDTITPAQVQAAFPLYTLWTGEIAPFGTSLQHYDLNPGFRPGTSRLVLEFEPPPYMQVLKRNPGRGMLTVDVGTSEYRAKKRYGRTDAATGKLKQIAAGEDLIDTYVYHEGVILNGAVYERSRWEPVKGKGTKLSSRCHLKLEVMTSNFMLSTIMPLIDSVNDAEMTAFGNAPIGSLRFAGAHTRRELTSEALYFSSFLFEFAGFDEATGKVLVWNEETVVQRYIYQVQSVSILNDDGTSTGNTTSVGDWKAAPGEDPYKAPLYRLADWSGLNGLIVNW